MELKLTKILQKFKSATSINRTFMELKPEYGIYIQSSLQY